MAKTASERQAEQAARQCELDNPRLIGTSSVVRSLLIVATDVGGRSLEQQRGFVGRFETDQQVEDFLTTATMEYPGIGGAIKRKKLKDGRHELALSPRDAQKFEDRDKPPTMAFAKKKIAEGAEKVRAAKAKMRGATDWRVNIELASGERHQRRFKTHGEAKEAAKKALAENPGAQAQIWGPPKGLPARKSWTTVLRETFGRKKRKK